MHRRSRTTAVVVVAVGALIAFGCNNLSGIADLTFDRSSSSSSSSGDDQVPTTPGADDDDDAGGGATCSDAGSLWLPIQNPQCLPCARAKCCAEMTACAGSPVCLAERACRQKCDPTDHQCVVNCRNPNKCALPTLELLSDCYLEKCTAECTDPVTPSMTDGGADSGACVAPFVGTCNPVTPQCGCGAAENCVYVGFGGETGCITAGAQAIDRACAIDADCAKGSVCARGACKPACVTDGDCGSGRNICLQLRRTASECSADVPIFGAGFCGARCNPVQPSAVCGTGLTCTAYTSGNYTDCTGPVGAGTGPGGCEGAKRCAAGYECLVINDDSYKLTAVTCERWCRVGLSDCPGAMVCHENDWAPTVDGMTYGTCRTPCELADPSSCGAGAKCTWFHDAKGNPYTDCYSSTGTGHGDGTCNTTHSNLECRPGDVCIQGVGSESNVYSCRGYCRIGQNDCPSGETCQTFTGAPTVNAVEYGFCR